MLHRAPSNVSDKAKSSKPKVGGKSKEYIKTWHSVKGISKCYSSKLINVFKMNRHSKFPFGTIIFLHTLNFYVLLYVAMMDKLVLDTIHNSYYQFRQLNIMTYMSKCVFINNVPITLFKNIATAFYIKNIYVHKCDYTKCKLKCNV